MSKTRRRYVAYPDTHDSRIAAGYATLASIYGRQTALLEDPMTRACGAPVGDFMEDFARQEVKTANQIFRRAKEVGDGAAVSFALALLESYLP